MWVSRESAVNWWSGESGEERELPFVEGIEGDCLLLCGLARSAHSVDVLLSGFVRD